MANDCDKRQPLSNENIIKRGYKNSNNDDSLMKEDSNSGKILLKKLRNNFFQN